MAAVFFKYTTEKSKCASKDHGSNYQRKSIEAFLTGNGWHSVGNQVFHSDPSFGTAKEQMLSQAKALRDIEELIKWKPSLRESFKDSLIIVGQVYDIDSLLNTPEVGNRKKRNTRRHNDKQGLQLDLKSPKECSVKKTSSPDDGSKTESDNASATAKPKKLGQPSLKTPENLKLRKTTRPTRNRPMGSASKVTSRPIVNFPRTPVKTAKNTTTTSMLTSGRCSSDINSNLLAGLENGPDMASDEDDMTPLYLPCLEEEEEEEEEEELGGTESNMACACREYSSYHVETFVKMDSCARKLSCTNINVDPSERVVV